MPGNVGHPRSRAEVLTRAEIWQLPGPSLRAVKQRALLKDQDSRSLRVHPPTPIRALSELPRPLLPCALLSPTPGPTDSVHHHFADRAVSLPAAPALPRTFGCLAARPCPKLDALAKSSGQVQSPCAIALLPFLRRHSNWPHMPLLD